MSWRTVTGILLVVVGCVGFGTVADDFHHTGELFGVAGILVAGVVLVVAGLDRPITSSLALDWVAVGISIGVVVGAAIDNLPTGVTGGAVLGVLGAAILSTRRR